MTNDENTTSSSTRISSQPEHAVIQESWTFPDEDYHPHQSLSVNDDNDPVLSSSGQAAEESSSSSFPDVLPLRSRCLSADAALETPPMTSAAGADNNVGDATWTPGDGQRIRSRNQINIDDEQQQPPQEDQEDWIADLNIFRLAMSKTDDDDDDDASVDYYDSTDFMQTNWNSVMEHIPPVGFAVVASGVFFFHPIIFMAGALTAISTVHAGRTLHDCMDTSILKGAWFGTADEEEENADQVNKTEPSNKEEMEHLKSDSAVASASRSEDSEEEKKSEVTSRISEVTYSATEDESSNVNLHSVRRNGRSSNNVKNSAGQDNLQHVATLPVNDQEQTTLFKTNPSTLDTFKSLQWVEQHYPPLQNAVILNQTFEGLNAIDVFNVFFSNDAPYNFKEFQKQRQDKDIEYGKWEPLEHVTQVSLHHKAENCNELDLGQLIQERVLKFDAKTNAFLGPPYAPTTKVQRALVSSKHLLVLEAKTHVTDIPFSDRFHVMERWVITADKVKADKYVSSLSIYSEVFFTKSCPFEHKITTTSKQTFSEIATQWCKMAQEALKLSEQHRTLRIQRSLESTAGVKRYRDEESALEDENSPNNGTKDDLLCPQECIEIQHLDGRRSWVVGEPGDRDLILARTGTDNNGNRRRLGSFHRVGKSIHKIVRRRTTTASMEKKLLLPPTATTSAPKPIAPLT